MSLTNNIIVSHTTGIYVYPDPTNEVTATHTLFYGNGADTSGGVVTSTDEIGGDPLFVNPAGGDYHLRAGSPAIDAGTAVPWLTTDLDGDQRPLCVGYDVGADEYVPKVYLPLVVKSYP
ncbi:MAG TPA: DUF5123 domain-containing protein [Thermoflexia bacterium]|nr:DUF5123 domain-containing protein [Thermoflexia bacterium]